jgi:hypothetical protein
MQENKPLLTKKLKSKKAVTSFLLSFLILYILIAQVDIKKTFDIAKNADFITYLLAFFTLYISLFLRVLRWRTLLVNAGFFGGLVELYEIFFLSWFANCIVPAKLGDVYRAYLLKKGKDAPTSGVLGTIFVERVIDIFSIVFLVLVIGIYIFGTNMPENLRFSLEIGAVICIILLLAIWFLKTQKKLFGYFPEQVGSLMSSFGEGTSASLTRASLPWIILVTAGIWFMEGVRLLLVTKALSIELPFPVILFVALGASFLTAVPLTPAGLGVVEVSVTGLFVLFGVGRDMAVSVALMDRLVSYWSILIFGGILYGVSKRT